MSMEKKCERIVILWRKHIGSYVGGVGIKEKSKTVKYILKIKECMI